MVYKFNTEGLSGKSDTYIELSSEGSKIMIVTGDYKEEIITNYLYLPKNEIDNMIIALTNLKNEISERERENTL